MRRNPELAHKVTQIPEIANARHLAIDKVTAAHLQVDLLSRIKEKNLDARVELETEERAMELMDEAVYQFHKYLRMKLNKYEDLLHEADSWNRDQLTKGNIILQKAIDIGKERGLT